VSYSGDSYGSELLYSVIRQIYGSELQWNRADTVVRSNGTNQLWLWVTLELDRDGSELQQNQAETVMS
jgi:hypothetical protein